jgi:hypothetical protein
MQIQNKYLSFQNKVFQIDMFVRHRCAKGGSPWRIQSHVIRDLDSGRQHWRSVVEPGAGQTTRCGGGATVLLVGGLSVGVVGGSGSALR